MSFDKHYSEMAHEDIPDLDFGEDNCCLKEVEKQSGQTEIKNVHNVTEPEQKRFTQRLVCLNADCEKQLEKARLFLVFTKSQVDTAIPNHLHYFQQNGKFLEELDKHYATRVDYLKKFVHFLANIKNHQMINYLCAQEASLQDTKREIVKLSSSQLDQGHLLLKMCEARMADSFAINAILLECIEILKKKCEHCKVEAMNDRSEEAKQHFRVFMDFINTLKVKHEDWKIRLAGMETAANESYDLVCQALDTIFEVQMAHYQPR